MVLMKDNKMTMKIMVKTAIIKKHTSMKINKMFMNPHKLTNVTILSPTSKNLQKMKFNKKLRQTHLKTKANLKSNVTRKRKKQSLKLMKTRKTQRALLNSVKIIKERKNVLVKRHLSKLEVKSNGWRSNLIKIKKKSGNQKSLLNKKTMLKKFSLLKWQNSLMI